MRLNRVNVAHRRELGRTIAAFLSSKISDTELIDNAGKFFHSDDGAVRGVMYRLWSTYDGGTHPGEVVRANTLDPEDLEEYNRIICFLYTDFPYQWPDAKRGCLVTFLSSALLKFVDVFTSVFATNYANERYLRTGDYDYWPFRDREQWLASVMMTDAERDHPEC